MIKVKDIPGGWITVFVGGAIAIYVINNASSNETVNKFSDDTVGLGVKTFGGLPGLLAVLSVAGAFLNEQTMGKLT